MDTILTIAMIVVFLFVTNVMDKKKEKAKRPPQRTDFPGVPPIPRKQPEVPPPMPQPWPRSEQEQTNASRKDSKRIDFEIPDLKKAPPADKGRMYQEQGAVLAEQAEQQARELEGQNKYKRYLEKKKRIEAEERAEEQAVYGQQAGVKQGRESGHEPMDVQPVAMAHAIAYAMLLDKPKAYETMRRYGGFRRT